MKQQKSFLEFFAGIGLIRRALEMQGWSCLLANDIDPAKRAIYADNFGGGEYVLADVHNLTPERIPSALLATACFPCTDLSLAGERKGLAGEESGTFWAFTGLLATMGRRQPPLLLIENVPGFLTSHGGRDFRAAIQRLNELGYRCDAVLIDAARFVPQSRQRLFIVAALEALHVMPPFSEAVLFAGGDLRPSALIRFILSNGDLRWSVRPLPALPRRKSNLDDIIENLPADDNMWWSDERVGHVISQMKPDHLAKIEGIKRGQRYSYATAYRRMRNGRSMAEVRNDGLSGCLRTPRGGSSRQILIKAGYGKVRVRHMTAREYARLQGVDDTFQINVPLNQGLFGFGDAVCVPVIRWISANYLEPLALAIGIGGDTVDRTVENGAPRSEAVGRKAEQECVPAMPPHPG